MCVMMSLSKHFIMIRASVTGQQSFRQVTEDFFYTGMMVGDLKHVGMIFRLSEVLEIFVKTLAS